MWGVFPEVLKAHAQKQFLGGLFSKSCLFSSFWDFSQKRLKQDRKKSWFLSMCPQYLWIDTPHAYGRTTLKFRFLMGIFKFSDPPYGGSNEVFGKNQNFPLFLNIKLHLKMPVNFNFLNILSFLGGLVPPLLRFSSVIFCPLEGVIKLAKQPQM